MQDNFVLLDILTILILTCWSNLLQNCFEKYFLGLLFTTIFKFHHGVQKNGFFHKLRIGKNSVTADIDKHIMQIQLLNNFALKRHKKIATYNPWVPQETKVNKRN